MGTAACAAWLSALLPPLAGLPKPPRLPRLDSSGDSTLCRSSLRYDGLLRSRSSGRLGVNAGASSARAGRAGRQGGAVRNECVQRQTGRCGAK